MPKENEPQIIDVEPEGEGAAPLSQERSLVLARDLLPETLLIVPAFDRPLFPKMMGPVLIARDELKREVAEALQSKQRHLGVVLVRPAPDESSRGPAAATDFHQVGVAVQVVQASPPPAEGPIQLVAQVLQRFGIREFVSEAPVFRARVEYWHETEFETNEELKAYSVAVVDSIKELVNLNPLYKEGLSLILDRLDVHDPGVLADFAAAMTTASGEELQEVLATRSVRKRIEQVLILLKREIEISKLKTQISKRIEERMSKQQREFFLKEQLKEIKHELGLSKEGAEAEVDRFRKRIGALTLTEEARERIDEEMEKLKLLDPSSPEFNVVRAYLDWLTVLPWGVYTEDSYDLKRASSILDEDHYGLTDVKDRILELISVGIVKGDLAGSIMLLGRPSRSRQDLRRALDREGPGPRVLPLLAGRDSRRGRDQGPPAHLHRRHAREVHPGHQDLQDREPADHARRGGQGRRQLPGRPRLGAAGGPGSGAEPGLPRPLPRRPLRPLEGALRVYRQPAGDDSPTAPGPDGGDPGLRLHPRREARNRAPPPDRKTAEGARSPQGSGGPLEEGSAGDHRWLGSRGGSAGAWRTTSRRSSERRPSRSSRTAWTR